MDLVFYPGTRPTQPEPLAIFLPPFSHGVAGEFLRRYAGERRIVVDPFGQSPALAIELAREGACLLVGCLNPIVRSLIQLQAQPPSPEVMRGTLAKLASARRASSGSPGASRSPLSGARPTERLEDHLRELYLVTCSACHKPTEAEAFVWSRETGREAGSPEAANRDRLLSRIYTCSQCGHEAEEPATPEDEEVVRPYLGRGIYYHLALERLAPPGSADRVHAEEALEVYPLRALYALFSVLVRVESLDLSEDERRAAEALLITALDEAHILRGYAPHTRQRPRSLQAPARYKEVNVWLTLQRAATAWSAGRGPRVESRRGRTTTRRLPGSPAPIPPATRRRGLPKPGGAKGSRRRSAGHWRARPSRIAGDVRLRAGAPPPPPPTASRPRPPRESTTPDWGEARP